MVSVCISLVCVLLYLFECLVAMHKATRVDHIPSELIQAGGGKLYKEMHKRIVLIWNKEKLPRESIIVPIHKKCDRMEEFRTSICK